jgi:hypothetical protein
MLRTKFSRVLVALGLLSSSVALAPADVSPCGALPQKLGACPGVSAGVGTGQIDLRAGGSSSGDSQGGGRGAQRGGDAEAPVRTGPPTLDEFLDNLTYREEFTVTNPPAPGVVTLADIASFRPSAGSDHMEPAGWAVVGLDTNFYSDAARHEVDGTLLGFPAGVRFTPRASHWTYGDGSSFSSVRPGASWASLRVAEFDPTATSHVFAAPGTYTIDLTVEFSAEYRFAGSGWVAIAGTLMVPANPIVATAGDAQTVLVGRDCSANPRGAGC